MMLSRFRVPAVRHLAWLCSAPQLLEGPAAFALHHHLPADWWERLQQWDRSPDTGPAVLTEAAHPRLGLYFERLYECVMTQLLGWELLAKNLQIAGQGRTLGELDFVLRNPASGQVEHHEIAVKFYLGYRDNADSQPLWYGPNTSDRLDLKTARLLNHQVRMTERPETLAALEAAGLPQPSKARIFMPGYLFYPDDRTLPAPAGVPGDHARGAWRYASQVKPDEVQCWAHLRKPHWLGPWVQSQTPDPEAAQARLAQVQARGTPRLFARLGPQSGGGDWVEEERFFVVPDPWPVLPL